MNPYQRMVQFYERHPAPGWRFEEMLRWHFTYGVVVSNDHLFMAALPVVRAQIEADFDPCPNVAQADCWCVSMLAGDFAQAFTFEPYPLPWIAIHRGHGERKRLIIYQRERLRALIE